MLTQPGIAKPLNYYRHQQLDVRPRSRESPNHTRTTFIRKERKGYSPYPPSQDVETARENGKSTSCPVACRDAFVDAGIGEQRC